MPKDKIYEAAMLMKLVAKQERDRIHVEQYSDEFDELSECINNNRESAEELVFEALEDKGYKPIKVSIK